MNLLVVNLVNYRLSLYNTIDKYCTQKCNKNTSLCSYMELYDKGLVQNVTVETEAKLKVDEGKIRCIERELENPHWNLQKNFVFRFGDGILRIRYEDGEAYLTAKGRNVGTDINKRQEIECKISEDFFKGFSKLFESNKEAIYYEKHRAREFYGGCMVCLDKLNEEYFIEIEGDESNVKRVIAELELQQYPFERRSYDEICMKE